MRLSIQLILLLTLFNAVFSWKAVFEKLEKLRDKGEEIKDKLDLKNFSLSSLKDLSVTDILNFEAPDLHAKLDKLKHIIPKDLDPSHHREIDAFWTTAFKHFGLPKPTELIECFGTVSGSVFFRKLRTVNDLLQHSKTGDNIKLHTDYVQVEVLMHALEHTHRCMVDSHDFERLSDSLHISHDAETLKRAKYLYYEAKYASLADDYKLIIDELDKKDFAQAGKLFAELFQKSVKDFKKQGEDLLSYEAFSNGLSATLGLELPTEGFKCYNSNQAKILMDFFKGIADAVTEGRWYKADQSTADYWKKQGKDLLSQIPDKVWKCDMNSKDSKQISEKIGMDLNSQEFRDKMWDYVSDHNIMFYSYLKSMNSAFTKGDYLHAGAAYAHLLEAIAKAT